MLDYVLQFIHWYEICMWPATLWYSKYDWWEKGVQLYNIYSYLILIVFVSAHIF